MKKVAVYGRCHGNSSKHFYFGPENCVEFFGGFRPPREAGLDLGEKSITTSLDSASAMNRREWTEEGVFFFVQGPEQKNERRVALIGVVIGGDMIELGVFRTL